MLPAAKIVSPATMSSGKRPTFVGDKPKRPGRRSSRGVGRPWATEAADPAAAAVTSHGGEAMSGSATSASAIVVRAILHRKNALVCDACLSNRGPAARGGWRPAPVGDGEFGA